mgnify:CR=1 FL=1
MLIGTVSFYDEIVMSIFNSRGQVLSSCKVKN